MPPNTNLVFDMETGDPDDVLTLILLLGHPWVNLKAVTITPGTPHQIAVVREVLRLMETDIPVGAFNIDHMKARGQPDEHYVSCVSAWHWKFLGKLDPVREAEVGSTVLYENLGSDTQLVTGAPVKNLGDLIRRITPDIQHPDSFGPTRIVFEMDGKVQAVEPKDTVWFGGDPKQLADMLAAAGGVSNG